MGMQDCIGRMMNAGRITPKTADELTMEVEKLIRNRGLDGDNLTTRVDIEREVLNIAVRDANIRLRAAAKEIKIFNEHSKGMDAHPISPDSYLADVMDRAEDGSGAMMASIMAPLNKMGVRFRSKYAGLFGGKFSEKGKIARDQLGRAIFGEEDVPSDIMSFKNSLQQVDDRRMALARNAGIDLAQRKRLDPQIWSKDKLTRNFNDAEDYARVIVDENGYTSDNLVTGIRNPAGLTRAIAKDAYDSQISGEHSVQFQREYFKNNPDLSEISIPESIKQGQPDLPKKVEGEISARRLARDEAEKAIEDTIGDSGRRLIKKGNIEMGNKINDTLLSKNRKSRVLHAPNYESWKAVNELAGEGDIIDQIYAHYAKAAHETNLAATLGVNYERMFKKLNSKGKLARGKTKLDERIKGAKGVAKIPLKLQKVFLDKNGSLLSNEKRFSVLTRQSDEIGNSGFADWAAGMRNMVGAGLLGGSSIVAITDKAFLKRLSRTLGTDYKNIENDIFRLMKDTLGSKELEETLVHYSAGIEYLMHSGGAGSRFTETGVVGRVSEAGNRAMDFVLGANGLNPMTRVSKLAAAIDIQRGVAKAHKGIKSFDDLSPEFKNIYKEFDIGPKEFKQINAAIEKIEIPGKKFTYDVVNTQKINDPFVLAKFSAMMGRLVREAVPEPGLEAKAAMTRGLKRGTLEGEAARTFWQLQSFPMTLMLDTLRLYNPNSTRLASTQYGKMKDAAKLTAAATTLGLIAIQARELSKGRDMLPWDSTALWGSAIVLSSPLGFATDLLPKTVSGGRSFTGGLGGPTVGVVSDVLDIVQDTKKNGLGSGAEKAARLGNKLTPLPFYADGMKDAVIDELRNIADPESFKRSQSATERFHKEKRENSLFGNGK